MPELPELPELPAVMALHGVARNYAWGSPTAIPRLQGQKPDGRPVAELWFGAHEDDPSPTADGETTLAAVIAAQPVPMLGVDVAEEYGNRLPFLVKLLAAAVPLSIQVHPNRPQAQHGFAAEQARGIPRDAPDRNYRDANHKPELLYALTPFEALCGFRPIERTLALLDALGVPELGEVAALLSGPDGLRAAFVHLLSLPDPSGIVAAVLDRCAQLGDDYPACGPASAVRRAAAAFPGDVGVVLSLLLNHVRLEPGEAIFLGAGNVHCYLDGLGVEVMANSDNVLRCGLTPKHVDVAEVLAVTDFTALAEPRCPVRAEGSGAGVDVEFDVPVPDFAVTVVDLDAHRGRRDVDRPRPHVVLCVAGAVDVAALGAETLRDTVRLQPAQAAFVPARDAGFTLAGSGKVVLATTGSVAAPSAGATEQI
ncbi:MAG TPA: mannose-6-phosphate isomerase, class I [Jatrophihabitantaceae bacterium]